LQRYPVLADKLANSNNFQCKDFRYSWINWQEDESYNPLSPPLLRGNPFKLEEIVRLKKELAS
jgi:hypothetical protein